jgi:F-type H+-transporting ATPase subunit delta
MIKGSIAKRYATALLKTVKNPKEYYSLLQEIKKTADVFENIPELKEIFFNPLSKSSIKTKAIETISSNLKLSQKSKNFLLLLLKHSRIQHLSSIARIMEELVYELTQKIKVQVITAFPFPKEYYERLKNQLEKKLSKTVILEPKVDPSIIGGVITKVGDTVYDGSIKTHLHKIERSLLS